MLVLRVSQVQTITTDTKCQELQAIMERDRARPHTERSGYKQQIASRMAAETVIGKDENMFRIEWVRTRRPVRNHELLSFR